MHDEIPYREPIRMSLENFCEIQMWQHKAAELVYEPACLVQIHVSRVREQRFEHELQKTSQTQV